MYNDECFNGVTTYSIRVTNTQASRYIRERLAPGEPLERAVSGSVSHQDGSLSRLALTALYNGFL